MKIRFLAAICLSFILATVSINAAISKPDGFPAFWKKFKAAAIKSDKRALAAMTKFPLETPAYQETVKTKAQFLKRFKDIFDADSNAAACFPKVELIKEDSTTYAVYCPFKSNPTDFENAPNKYFFELTKTGWKFAGLDNINE